MYPHTITIFNKLNIKGVVTYFPTVLKGVLYQDSQGFTLGSVEHFTNNKGYVQIPHTIGGYVPKKEWNALVDKTGKWTLSSDDIIYKGDTSEIDPKKIDGRTIETYENIDYSIFIAKHYGVTLK